MKRVTKFAFVSGAALLASAAAFAQTAPAGAPAPGAAPAPNPFNIQVPGVTAGPAQPAPPLKDNAAAAALFKDVKTAGDPAPVPGVISGNTNTAHPIENYVPVTDAYLRNPDPSDWAMMRGNYQGWGF